MKTICTCIQGEYLSYIPNTNYLIILRSKKIIYLDSSNLQYIQEYQHDSQIISINVRNDGAFIMFQDLQDYTNFMYPKEMYISAKFVLMKNVNIVQFSKCGNFFVLGDNGGQVKIFKTSELIEIYFDSLLYQIQAICFDNNWCFYASNNIVKGINIKNQKQYHLDIGDITCIQFTKSYKERVLLLGSSQTIHIYSFKMKLCELKVGRLVDMLGMENILLSMNKHGDLNFHYLDVFSEYATIQITNENGLKCMSYYQNLAILDEDGKISIVEIKQLKNLYKNFQKQNFRSLETGNLLMTEYTQKEIVNELYINEISKMNYSNNELLVVRQANGNIVYWNSIQLLGFYKAHENAVQNIEFYKEDSIVSTSKNELMLFDITKKTEQHSKMPSEIVSVQFKNNQMLISLKNGQLSLWTINDEIKLKIQQNYEGKIYQMQFNPISSIIALSQELKIRLLFYYETFSNSIFKDIHTIQHHDFIRTIQFFTSQVLAYADTQHLCFFNIQTLSIERRIPVQISIKSLAFHDYLIILNGYKELQVVSQDGVLIGYLDFSPIDSCFTKNSILSATHEKVIEIDFNYQPEFEQDYHSDRITSLILKYPKVYSSSLDKSIKVWSAVKETLETTISHKEPIQFMECQDAIIVSASSQNIYIWNIDDQKLIYSYTETQLGELQDLKFSDIKLLTLWDNRTVRIQRLEDNTLELERVFLNEEYVNEVQFFYRDFIGLNSEQVFFWSLEDQYVLGRKVWQSPLKNMNFTCINASKFGMLVAVGSAQGVVYVLSLEYIGIQVFEFRFRNQVQNLQFISVDRLLITYASNITYVYDFKSRQVLREIQWQQRVTSISVEGAILSVVLDYCQIITQSLNINKCNLQYWQLQTQSLKQNKGMLVPLEVQTLYQTEKFQQSVNFRKSFGLVQRYYPKFKIFEENNLMRLGQELCILSDNYYIKGLWDLIRSADCSKSTIQQISHIIVYKMNAKVSLEMFIQICQYLSKNEGEFIRSIFYEILENQSSQGGIILQQIFQNEKYSQQITFNELQLLYSMMKFIKENVFINYKCIVEKLSQVTTLNLSSNAYLNSKLYKNKLLKNLNQQFQDHHSSMPLITERYNQNESKYANLVPKGIKTTQKLLDNVVQVIEKEKLNDYDKFINGFLLDLIILLPDVRNLNLDDLNLNDEFCINFTKHYINEEYVPNLSIQNNSEITKMGLKYLEILYDKHNYSQLKQNYVQKQKTNQLEYCLYCQVYVCKDCHQQHSECSFCFKCLKFHKRKECKYQQLDDKGWLNQIYHDFYRYKKYCLAGNLRMFEKMKRKEYRIYKMLKQQVGKVKGQKQQKLKEINYWKVEEVLNSKLILIIFTLWQLVWYLIVLSEYSYQSFNEYIFLIFTLLSSILEMLFAYLINNQVDLKIIISSVRRYELIQLLLLRNSLGSLFSYIQIIILSYCFLQVIQVMIRIAIRKQDSVLRNINFYTNMSVIYEYQQIGSVLQQLSCNNMLGRMTQQRVASILSLIKSFFQLLICLFCTSKLDRFIIQSISLGGISILSQLFDIYQSQRVHLNLVKLDKYRRRIGFKQRKNNDYDPEQQ